MSLLERPQLKVSASECQAVESSSDLKAFKPFKLGIFGPFQEALLDSDPDCRDLLSTTSFEAVFEAVPEVEAVEMPEAPAPVPVSKGNPFERFSALSPKAQVGTMAFSAALEVKETKEAKETSGASGASVAQRVTEGVATAARRTVDFEQRHQLTRRAAEATRSTVEAAREANERYGVTEKIGQGISTAAAKTVEFERQHQVSSRAMQGVKASVDAARDANERYHITEKMGQGASAAYAKAKDLEEKHQVSSKVANGLKSGASTVASAASTVASKNPFAARQRNPFAAR